MKSSTFTILADSIEHLVEKNPSSSVSDLEAEIINLASYVYLKGSSEIDFTLDYIDKESLNSLRSRDWATVDQIFDEAAESFSKYYNHSHALIGKQGVRTNIQLAPNYGSFLKSYFISKHGINAGSSGSSNTYKNFSSPKNSLWGSDGEKVIDSPTQRDVNYLLNFDNNTFEVLINPYNPLVTGTITSRTSNRIKGLSNDTTREFVFDYDNGELFEVTMYRLDKGDFVKYHK